MNEAWEEKDGGVRFDKGTPFGPETNETRLSGEAKSVRDDRYARVYYIIYVHNV